MKNIKQGVVVALSLTCLSPPASAGGLFDNLKEKFNEQINQTKEQVRQSFDNATNPTDEDANTSEPASTESRKNRAAGPTVESSASETAANGEPQGNSLANKAKALLGGATALNPTRAGSTSDMDVIGLRLGMTPEEAKTALQAYDATMRLDEQHSKLPRLPNSSYLRWISATSKTGEQVIVEFAPPPHAPTVINLTRTAKYSEGARPTLDKTLQALKQKYGQPSIDKTDNAMMRQLIWLHDGTGKIMASAPVDRIQPCTMTSTDQLINVPQHNMPAADCGLALKVLLATGINAAPGGRSLESDGLVGQLTTTMTNAGELVRTTQATRSHIDQTVRTRAENVGAPRL